MTNPVTAGFQAVQSWLVNGTTSTLDSSVPLRDELLSVERLEERAHMLAGRFTVDPRPLWMGRSLFPRFNDNARHLKAAYRLLAGDVHDLDGLEAIRRLLFDSATPAG